MNKATYVVVVVVFWLVFVDKVHAAEEGKLPGQKSSGDLQQKMRSLARGQRRSTNSAGGLRPTRTTSRSLKEAVDKDCGVDVGVGGGGGALKTKKICDTLTLVPATSPATWRPAPAPTISSVVETSLPTLSTLADFVSATPTMSLVTTTSPSNRGFAWTPPTLDPILSPPNQQSPTTTPPVQVPVTQPSTSVTSAPQPSSATPPSSASPPERTTTSSPSLSPSRPASNSTFGTIDKSTITNERSGTVDTKMACREPIPDVASGVTDQLITYAYILNVMPGTIVSFILPTIEQVIQNEMSKVFLNCSFTTTSTSEAAAVAAAAVVGRGPSFFVHQLSTAPVDQPQAGCVDEERLFDAECYHITGFMRAVIFYLPTTPTTAITNNVNNSDPRLGQDPEHRRFLASQIEDPNVLEAFEVWFEQFFASAAFLINVNNSRVASLNFAGITNEYQPPPAESQDRTLVVVGAVLAGCVGVIIAALLVNHGIKKHQQRAESRFYQEAMDYVDEELDKDDDNKDDGRSSTITRNMIRNVEVVGEDETVHTSFPVLVDDGLRDAEDIRRDQNNYSLVKHSSRNVNQLDGVHFVSSVDPASMLEATKKDLGRPTRNDQVNSPRRYNVRNTVEL